MGQIRGVTDKMQVSKKINNKKVDVTEPLIRYVLPKGSIIFRVERFSAIDPPYLFYAYFSGNFREAYIKNKRAWVSRCAGDVDAQTRVRFMRTVRDIELMDMSMNSYTYNDPSDEDLAVVSRLSDIASERIRDSGDLSCTIDAIKTLYNVESVPLNPKCPTMIDYTVGSFLYSHLNINGWVRMADDGSILMDEVMLIRDAYTNDLTLIEEYDCSMLDKGAPIPRFMTNGGDMEQPQIYIKRAIKRRRGTNQSSGGRVFTLTTMMDLNEGLYEMTSQNLSECIHCAHPCSIYENGDKEKPFCSISCQALNRI